MSRGPRKYPARQEFIDAAKRAGFTDAQIVIDNNYSYYKYPRGSYRSEQVECVRVRLENGPTGLFKKDTGAFIKGESHHGASASKTEILTQAVSRSPARLAEAAREAKRLEEERRQQIQADVWERYQHAMEIEKLAVQRAITIAMEAGMERDVATDAILSLLDSGALERISEAKTARIRAGQGYEPGRSYKQGEWKDGKLVKW